LLVDPEGRDLDAVLAELDDDDPELLAHGDRPREELAHLFRYRGGRDVDVVRSPAQEAVAEVAAGEEGLVALLAQATRDVHRLGEGLFGVAIHDRHGTSLNR